MPSIQYLFQVREFDKNEGFWINISEPSTFEQTKNVFYELTNDGSEFIGINEDKYYKIFPADDYRNLNTRGI